MPDEMVSGVDMISGVLIQKGEEINNSGVPDVIG